MTQLYQIDSQTHPGRISLNINNLAEMVEFYQTIIGLSLVREEDGKAYFNTGNNSPILLILNKLDIPSERKATTGLFHVAYLLPTRKDLGNTLASLIRKEAPLQGASNHGYSEAIYLADPEGNGIEIYRDRPIYEWDIKEDGTIKGITEAMDADGVLSSRDDSTDKFPKQTTIGHVHLSVAELNKTQDFYATILGLTLKDTYGSQAKFFAAGTYHHHIGTNTWGGVIEPPKDNDLGLNYFTIVVPSTSDIAELTNRLETEQTSFTTDHDGRLIVKDPNGITLKIETEEQFQNF